MCHWVSPLCARASTMEPPTTSQVAESQTPAACRPPFTSLRGSALPHSVEEEHEGDEEDADRAQRDGKGYLGLPRRLHRHHERRRGEDDGVEALLSALGLR